ncbi:glycosyltransferase family 4 protein, partial [Candidatus Woesearchaeota archaeon]|nr:glycosyltransferase family 4 protein [Candidatus Woesearchaeota archaeon]
SKGMEYAAASVPLIRIPEFRYIFIVAKDYGRSYRKFSAEMTKADSSRTLLLEPVSYEELPDYIAAADCLVVPSLSEGFGYTAAEAAAMGKIIVASSTTSLPEVVSGKYVLVEPKSAKALAEGIEKAHKRSYAVSKLKRFTIDENVKRHLSVYYSLTKQDSQHKKL